MHRAAQIMKRLFRVFAHIYHVHYEKMVELQMDASLNTTFKHFVFFVKVFGGMLPCLQVTLSCRSFS
jgi:MOB kinase activator 1